MPKEKTTYVAEDGTEFPTYAEALEYEENYSLACELRANVVITSGVTESFIRISKYLRANYHFLPKSEIPAPAPVRPLDDELF